MQKRDHVLTIKELNRFIKIKLETDRTLQNIWVRGEISNFTHHSSGHMYFTLKDSDSRVKSVMFAGNNQKLAFLPKDGARVLARGSISVYERDGQYQFYVAEMQPDGIGNLFLAFEQLKAKLEQEGLFSQESKKKIPGFPKAVGVITSPTGAAVRDIMITMQRRNPAIPILLYPVSVQGVHAAPTIVRAIEEMNRLHEVDVLIVGRGGGSLEELWAFNEEMVARAIYASRIPVISAVGHETDYTIADFTADLRAATPTAAAELAVPHHLELKQQLHYYNQRLLRALRINMQNKLEKLNKLKRSPYFLYPRKYLLESAQRSDRLKEQLVYRMRSALGRQREGRLALERMLLRHNPRERIVYMRRNLDGMRQQIHRLMQTCIHMSRQQLISRVRQLDALSPLKVMQRGYSIVYDEAEQKLLNSISQVQPGDLLKIRMKDGRVDCHVWSMKGDDEK